MKPPRMAENRGCGAASGRNCCSFRASLTPSQASPAGSTESGSLAARWHPQPPPEPQLLGVAGA